MAVEIEITRVQMGTTMRPGKVRRGCDMSEDKVRKGVLTTQSGWMTVEEARVAWLMMRLGRRGMTT
jgi:hypothetical protein